MFVEAYSKLWQVGTVVLVLIICYTILFSLNAIDNSFLVTGGLVGFIGSSIVVVDCTIRRDARGNWPAQISLLFWRAFCDVGLSVRFLAQPLLNYYICGAASCTRLTGHADRCAFPSFILEFFVMASELWFLCNGLGEHGHLTLALTITLVVLRRLGQDTQ
jgi:hypothetical protein